MVLVCACCLYPNETLLFCFFPKVLGLTASVVNNVKRGEMLEVKLRRLEMLMRARLVTSTDSSIDAVTGVRKQLFITYPPGGANVCAGERYWPVMAALLDGVKSLEGLVVPFPLTYTVYSCLLWHRLGWRFLSIISLPATCN